MLKFSLLILIHIFFTDGSKLNVPRVLMPAFKDVPSNFTLEVTDNGCYKWSVSRKGVIQLNLINPDPVDGCSSQAQISSISREFTRNTVVVVLTEVTSGQNLRCDVIVDVIRALNISTTTRELFIEEAPEKFEVRAFDDQGNEFTTLDGIEFKWTISSNSWLSDFKIENSVLRFISFRDSSYIVPQAIKRLDDDGLQGHFVLLEGVKTGSAKVSVELPHPEYKNVQAAEVQLVVVANLLIEPADAFLLKGDTFRFKLLQVQNGKYSEIPLGSSQYYFDVENSGVAKILKDDGLISAENFGSTKIILFDRNVDEKDVVRLPHAYITVAQPAYLSLNLLPYRNWNVFENDPTSIVVEIVDAEEHRFSIGDGVKVKTNIPNEFYRITEYSQNGTYYSGSAVKPGKALITATLDSIVNHQRKVITFKKALTTQAEMLIYSRIEVTPSQVILAWDPIIKPKYDIQLEAKGGDNNFQWSAANSSVATAKNNGSFKVFSPGFTQVFASMQKNIHNYGTGEIHVLTVSRLEIVEYVLEEKINDPILIHVALYGDRVLNNVLRRVPFTDCEQIKLNVTSSDPSFIFQLVKHTKSVKNACVTLGVVSPVVGTSKITVSYSLNDEVLEDSVTVGAYHPLEAVHPVKETVLAVASSRHIVFRKGPKPWTFNGWDYKREIRNSENNLKINEVTTLGKSEPNEFYVYTVECRSIGESFVTLSIANIPKSSRCKHVEAKAEIKVICAQPRYLSLKPDIANFIEKCPMNLHSDWTVALCHHPIEVAVVIKDAQGNIFDNATSLEAEWNIVPADLGVLTFPRVTFLKSQVENNYLIPSGHFQTITPKNTTGSLRVTVSISGYRTELLKASGITNVHAVLDKNSKDNHLKSNLMFLLVDDTKIIPNQTSIFNHPQDKLSLKILEGSGHYNLITADDSLAQVKYNESSRILEVTPLEAGVLKLVMYDLCLKSKPATAEIQIVKIGSIKIDMVDKIEIGTKANVSVKIYDLNDNLLPVMKPDILGLSAHLDSNILSVTKDSSEDSEDLKRMNKDGIKFEIFGIELGDTNLIFSAGEGDRQVRSQPVSIHVFPALQLSPKELTITIGAQFQLTVIGGPQPDCIMEFVSTNSSIAKANNIGLIEGVRLGITTVKVQAVGFNKNTRNRVVYARSSVTVNVVPLEGIKIHSPIVRLKVGAKMPVWVGGIPDQLNPLILGSIKPPLLFKWYVVSPDFIEIKDVLSESGIEVRNEDRISVHLRALKAGRVFLYVNVTIPAGIHPYGLPHLSDHIELEVFEELKLLYPVHPNGCPSSSLLFSPHSKTKLETNKDGDLTVFYSIMGDPSTSPVLHPSTVSASSVLSIDKNGVITTGSAIGRTIIIANSVESSGQEQNIAISVEVKPVHYLMLHVRSKLLVDQEEAISQLPRGINFEFYVSYHDKDGTEFTSVKSVLKSQTNRFDLTQVGRGSSNNSLKIDSIEAGETVLKVWDEATPYKSEGYVKLSVDYILFPTKISVTVGEMICFSMPLMQKSGQLGVWSSADPEILSISPNGLGRVKNKHGTVVISYQCPPVLVATTVIEVLPLQSLVFLSIANRNISNAKLEKPFTAPLVLLNEKDLSSKKSNLVAKEDDKCRTLNYTGSYYPFHCFARLVDPNIRVDIRNIFNIRPHFDFQTGFYSCLFEPVKFPSTNVTHLSTNLSVWAVSGNIESDPIMYTFYSAITVETSSLTLTEKNFKDTFVISGLSEVLKHVSIVAYEDLYITITKREVVPEEHNVIVLNIHLNEDYWRGNRNKDVDTSFSISSPLTGQTIKIPVFVRLSNEQHGLAPCMISYPFAQSSYFPKDFSSYFPIVLSIFFCLIITLYNVCKSRGYFVSSSTGAALKFNEPKTNPVQPKTHSSGRRLYVHRTPFECTPIYGSPKLSTSKNSSYSDSPFFSDSSHEKIAQMH